MPWSGGAFTRTNGVHTGATLWVQDRDAGTKILATRHDTHDQDLADGINSTLEKSGSNAATGNLDLGSKRITLLADGTAKTDAATVNQIQSNGPAYQASDTGTANAHVIALSPAITAYASGQKVTFKSGAASTTASTLNVNGLGVKAIKKLHDQDIASGDIESGSIVTVVYDGTNFQMTSQVAAAASTGAPAAATSAKTAAYTVIAGDAGSTILCSAASADYAVALTAAGTLGDGFTVTLKKSDATKFMITINPNSTETIDGLPDLKLRNEHSEVTLICDGSNWHLISHENIEIEYNAIENSSFLVDQYNHITRTGLGGSALHFQDRWSLVTAGSASARWTMSVESAGGVHGESDWAKFLCTTADASPGSSESHDIKQNIIGNNAINAGFLGTDNKFENGVLSMDIIGHLDTPDAPYTAAIGLVTLDGTKRKYIGNVAIAADATWQRVSLVIPEDGTAVIENGVTAGCRISVSLYAGSGEQATNETWITGSFGMGTSSSQNWASATNNYIGFTNVKLQPGQIATPFIPRLYAEELDICQFYFYKWEAPSIDQRYFFSGARATTRVGCDLSFPRDMRVAPTGSVENVTNFKLNTTSDTDEAMTGLNGIIETTEGAYVEFQISAATTGVVGNIGISNTNARLLFNSEI